MIPPFVLIELGIGSFISGWIPSSISNKSLSNALVYISLSFNKFKNDNNTSSSLTESSQKNQMK